MVTVSEILLRCSAYLIQKIFDNFWVADRKAHEDYLCSLQRTVGKSWELLTYSIQGLPWMPWIQGPTRIPITEGMS